MQFFHYRLPLLFGMVSGVVLLLSHYFPPIEQMAEVARGWYTVVAAFALILGVLSLVQVNIEKVHYRKRDWQYAFVTLAGFTFMLVGWIYKFYGQLQAQAAGDPSLAEGYDVLYSWGFDNMYMPLAQTMFSLLAFFVASAAFRAFRARTVEAGLLLFTAFMVMIGQVPIGAVVWEGMPEVTDWIMNFPNKAGERAVMIGIALGVVSMSLRIITGIERTYLGD